MRIVLINYYPEGTMARYLLSSYTLKAYLAQYLSFDPEIEVLNFSPRQKPEKAAVKILKSGPDLVCFSCYLWNIHQVLDTAAEVRRQSDCKLLLGGPEISYESVKAFPDPELIDYYILGEGERPLKEMLELLAKGSPIAPSDLPDNVTVWEQDQLRKCTIREPIQDLDEIPSVYLTGTLDDRFFANDQAFFETQRGCLYRCGYCLYHKQRGKVAHFSTKRICEELRYLIVEKKIKALRFLDAVFTSDIQRCKEILQYLLKLRDEEGADLPWLFWELTYQNIDDEFMELSGQFKTRQKIHNYASVEPRDTPQMYSDLAAGYTAINAIGLQSFQDDALRKVNRAPVRREKLQAFLEKINAYNLILKIDMMFGLPEETAESFFDGIEWLFPYLEKADHVLNIHRVAILPGTRLEEKADEFGLTYQPDAPHTVLATDRISAEDFEYHCRLLAVLFRIVNSPLRGDFFREYRQSRKTLLDYLGELLDKIEKQYTPDQCQLTGDGPIDDEYWNTNIYKELPTEWLIRILNRNR